MKDIPKSFIREILKVAVSEDIISFAGGLPNADLFPVKALKEASARVFNNKGAEILQYSNSEGYLPLREYIARRYLEKEGLQVSPEDILITSGSQQALDLIGKVLIDLGDKVIMEEPGYLGAIQAFSVYQPEFIPVPLRESGMDTSLLEKKVAFVLGNPFYVDGSLVRNTLRLNFSCSDEKTIDEGIRRLSRVLVD